MTLNDNQASYDKMMDYYYAHHFDYVPGLADNNNVELGVSFFGVNPDGENGSPVGLVLYGEDIVQGGFEVRESINPPGSFEVGSVAAKSMKVRLANFDGRFDGYKFENFGIGVVVNYRIAGKWAALRHFSGVVVSATETYSNVLELSCSGKFRSLDRAVNLEKLKKLKKVGDLVDCVASVDSYSGGSVQEWLSFGIPVWKQDIPTADEAFSSFPSGIDESTTRKEVLGWLAQASGCFACEGDHPSVVFKWYDKFAFQPDSSTVGGVVANRTKEAWKDGGLFRDGKWGASAFDDGGTFNWNPTNYANNHRLDGLYFTSYNYHVVNALKDNGVSKESLYLSEILVLVEDKANDGAHAVVPVKAASDDVDTYRPGACYATVSGNAFFDAGGVPMWSHACLGHANDTRFNPFKVTCLADPRVRLGDPVVVVLASGQVVKTYVTEYTYATSGFMTVGCEADSSVDSYQDTMSAYRNWMK